MKNKNSIFNKTYILLLSLCFLVYPISLFGDFFDGLDLAVRSLVKKTNEKNPTAPPKTNQKRVEQQLDKQSSFYEQKFPDQIKILKENGWTVGTFYHVVVGEYVNKKYAEENNKNSLESYQRRLNSKKRKNNPPQKPKEVSPGLMKGCHTEKGFEKLESSCELEDDIYEKYEDGSYTLLAFKLNKGFVTPALFKQAYTNTTQGQKIEGIKTLWPLSWKTKDIIEASGEIVKELKEHKRMPNQEELYVHTATKNGVMICFEARIRQINGKFIVQTTYPKPSDKSLKKVDQDRKQSTTTTTTTNIQKLSNTKPKS